LVIIDTIFFASLVTIFYIYAGYPIALWVMKALKKNDPPRKHAIEPAVTILVPAYNEASCILDTVMNKLSLDYPSDRFEVLVVSDGSTDRTDDIVRRIGSNKVRLLRQEPRAGKTSAINMAIPEARGEILVFSDANSIYERGALKAIVANFADERVGYVTGKMIYANPDGSVTGDGCSLYMKYENTLRSLETSVGSVVGVNGGIDAIRKSLYTRMNADQLPDFVLPLKVIEQGYKVVYEPDAILKEHSLKASRDEYRMRVRVSLRALWALSDMRELLSIRRYGLYSWQLFSHKHLRYMAYLFMASAYVSNLILAYSDPNYLFFFLAQSVCYGSALVAFLLEKNGFRCGPFYIPYYFTLLNLASAHATYKFIRRQKQVLWTPRKG
jgi:cellulose synthase/poly-beta-1,6-N-acetylglucosamine synthase-like glycosyltransferase